MVEVGKFNTLKIVKEVDFGVYLDGDDLGTILLPKREVPEGASIGQALEVFIYFDSKDLLIATTRKPKLEVGRCALLRVADINQAGAFMDWGLPKELLVPYNEQQKPMQEGFSYVVYAFHDTSSDRIAASSKLSHYLEEEAPWLKPQQEVSLLVASRTELGYKAVVDDQYLGLIFREDAFRPLKIGERLAGSIKTIRPDGKIDLLISAPAGKGRDALSEQILDHLRSQGGRSTLTDKSDPELIYKTFKVSKKKYKQALGGLYKQKQITISSEQITLTS